MFDEYDDRHLIPQAGNSTPTWPSPPTLPSVTSPSRDFGRLLSLNIQDYYTTFYMVFNH